MIGPGKGHNVKRFLDYFENDETNKLSYFFFNFGNHYSLKKFTNIDAFSYKQLHRLFKILRNKSLNIIWVHNWCPWPIILLVILLKHRETVLNYNIWSEHIPKISRINSLRGFFYKYFMTKCDYLQCHWYSTFRYFEDSKDVNPILIPWGIEKEYFESKDSNISEFSKRFINSIDSSKYNFFIPKSINNHNRHDLVIEAVSILIQSGIKNFVVYIWLGNHVNKVLLNQYTERILELNISKYIVIIEHPFLSITDIKKIWESMDCCLQLLNNDQLSTSILEAMIFNKEIIASDIFAYRMLNYKTNLCFELVANDIQSVAVQMKKKILGSKTKKNILDRRREFVYTTRQFEKNIILMLQVFSKKWKIHA